MKVYCVTDETKYLWDFWLYQGEESEREHKPATIVLDFAERISKTEPARPHIMIADSYYGSLGVVEQLNKMKWGALVSCKADRPSFLFTDKLHVDLEKGQFNSIHNRYFSALSYYDKARVNLISNFIATHRIVQNQDNTKRLPAGIYWYRKWLGGVDHFDRWLHLYMQQHRNIKWTQALLVGLLKMTINNTLIIAKERGLNETLRTVTLHIIKHLSEENSLRKRKHRESFDTKKTTGNHYPSKREKSALCRHCLDVKKKSKAQYECLDCNVPLHVDCWVLYHEK